jgi:hypothetical protein
VERGAESKATLTRREERGEKGKSDSRRIDHFRVEGYLGAQFCMMHGKNCGIVRTKIVQFRLAYLLTCNVEDYNF